MSKTEWIRPEFQGREDELETQEQSAERTGTSLYMMRSYVRRYPGEFGKPGVFPQPALLINSRQAYRPIKEIDEFLEWLRSSEKKPRTPGEVARSQVTRIALALEKAETSANNHRVKLEASEREVVRLRASLKKAQEKSALLNKE